ncbi:MAG: dienelactone hydrolase family protein [bacterium]|nr:dienelactone hydrolase family protein [bacterium]
MRRVIPLLFIVIVATSVVAALAIQRGLFRPSNLRKNPLTSSAPILFVLTTGGEPGEMNGTRAAWRPLEKQFSIRVIVPETWDEQSVPTDAQRLKNEYPAAKIFISGFSNGGYNACEFAMQNPDLFTGAIPLGAFCDPLSVLDQPRTLRLKVLTVVGERDTWARGDDLEQIDDADRRLAKYGIVPQLIIVPGLGHEFPTAALDRIGRWIEAQQAAQP